jgi:adenine-specific DNA-methyltransferase
METIEKLDGKTLNLVKENISALKSLFPEAFSEEKIDFDKLRLLLGDEVETSSEKYSFNWHGKSEAIKLALKQSSGTLKPCVKDSKNWDTTKNLYIEGDNLEVLRILQGAYRNKVKMIYIDPPYNTGKDFVYKDSFKDNIKNYKEQVQETGKANPETAGRYHTNWLNMMYPRLKLARNLLKDDGVIFISIDDHEVHNLRKICDEIFGEENFISSITVVNNIAGRSDRKHIATAHEFILIFQKSNLFESTGLMLSESQLQEYKFRDSKGKLYRKQGLRKRGSGARRIDRPNMFYPIYVNPETMQLSLEKSEFKNSVEILPKLSNGNDGRWRWGKTTFCQAPEIKNQQFHF